MSVVALAETNTDEINKGMYKLGEGDEYMPVYSKILKQKILKQKEVDLPFISKMTLDLNKLSNCNENIESIFLKIINTTDPVTVGAVYHPPNRNIDLFNEEVELII